MYAALIAKQQDAPAASASKPAEVVGHFTDGHFSSGPPKGSAPSPAASGGFGFGSSGPPKGSVATPAAASPVAPIPAIAPRMSTSAVTARPAAGAAELSALAEVKVS